jgi:AAA15 family ATPase/GTPase
MENNTESPNNFLNWVDIKNFKSIKDLHLDCKRVNVFIGKPNVGKSNILEGLGLLGGSYGDKKYMDGAIRYAELDELFYDIDSTQEIEINSNLIKANLKEDVKNNIKNRYKLKWMHIKNSQREFYLTDSGDLGIVSASPIGAVEIGSAKDIPEDTGDYTSSPVKKYDFEVLSVFKNTFSSYLLPPHGWNLFSVIDKREELKNEFGALFKEQNLEFVLSRSEKTFTLQKKKGDYVYQYPFLSIADTFRRFMFYLTAVESNNDSIIILEEPEVHSFPPYVQTFAFRMIESETNQFFVSTHSPYLLQTLIENLKDDQLNVFITYYEDYQTKVRALTPEELSEVQEFSIDVFYNLRRFTPPINA